MRFCAYVKNGILPAVTLPAPEGHTPVPLVYQGRVKTAGGQEAGAGAKPPKAAAAAVEKKPATKGKRRRPRKPKPSILVRRSVERMSLRQLKKVRGAERVWKHRLIMRQVRRAGDVEEEEAA